MATGGESTGSRAGDAPEGVRAGVAIHGAGNCPVVAASTAHDGPITGVTWTHAGDTHTEEFRARDPEAVTLHEVVAALDGEELFTECVLGLPGCGAEAPCPLHDAWVRRRDQIELLFRRATLAETGYGAVSVRAGDGREGWPEHAPYDRAYLTCAAPDLPSGVVEQVRPGGRVLAPVGDRRQRLVAARKRADGGLDRESHGGVRFVPLQ